LQKIVSGNPDLSLVVGVVVVVVVQILFSVFLLSLSFSLSPLKDLAASKEVEEATTAAIYS
jgi:hypothetical protein